MNIDFALETLWMLALFRYGGFEFKAVGDKWLHETDTEEENARNQGNKFWPDNNSSLLYEKIFCGLWSRMTSADVNKIKVSECHSVPVL